VAIKGLTGSATIMRSRMKTRCGSLAPAPSATRDTRWLEAKSGEAALELIRDGEETIDLLITDVVMPRMDGRL